MTEIREKAIAGLAVGDRFVISRTFTEADVNRFAKITRDFNPVHFDERFTAAKDFNGRVCHGLLVAGMISEIGGQIGWLASEMQFAYKKPVYFGDTITCDFEITEIGENGRAVAIAEYKNQDGIVVIEGVLKGLLPGEPEKGIMRTLL